MPGITLNGNYYSYENLREKLFRENASAFEKTTLEFCHAWLNDQNEFTIQTSGSTGAPKSIALLRAQMEVSARQTIQALHLRSSDTSLVCLDTKYIAGQMMLVRSMVLGMNATVVEPSANPFNSIGEQQTIDFVALVPYQLENILDNTPENLNKVRCAIIGGAPVNLSLKEKVKKSACAIYATYGMTETISHIALQKMNGTDAQEYFDAFDDIDLRLDDRGCLIIKTVYLNEIITNDLVELVDKRKFKWLGRIDNVINSGGVKVIPEKVEAVFERVLIGHSISQRFFIGSLIDEKLGQRVIMIVEGAAFASDLQDQVLTMASLHLTKYELPKELKFVNTFVETASGKINRFATLSMLS